MSRFLVNNICTFCSNFEYFIFESTNTNIQPNSKAAIPWIFFIQDFLGKSDPYLELARSKEDGTFVVVHRTEVRNTGKFVYMYE